MRRTVLYYARARNICLGICVDEGNIISVVTLSQDLLTLGTIFVVLAAYQHECRGM